MGSKFNSFMLTSVFVILIIALVGGGYWLFTQQDEESTTQTIQQIATESNKGDLALAQIIVYDREASNQNTVATVPVYVYSGTTFARDGTASSTTRVSQKVTRGESYSYVAFNGSYYGDIRRNVVINADNDDVDLEAHAICRSGLDIKLYDESLKTDRPNITGVGANQKGSMEKMRVDHNDSNCAYNLAGFYFDTVSTSNISNIELSGKDSAISSSNIGIERVKEYDDYVFELNTPVMMEDGDTYDTGKITVEADGDGCAAELVTVYAFDKAHSRSQTAGKGILENVIESDAPSPADVGGADFSDSFYCKA